MTASRARRLLVTGGAGFIGANLVQHLLELGHEVGNLDKLVFPGSRHTVAVLDEHPRHHFFQADLCDTGALEALFRDFRPEAVLHLAAESHVDRSIDRPGDFIRSNLLGTYQLLEAARVHLSRNPALQDSFRLLHVSTDEVYGSLGPEEAPFREEDPYRPSSPYSASKAGSDHLAHAWRVTYGLPVIITNCSNNYGPWQFPEKLIPLLIAKALAGEPMPIYGTGENVRDWLWVGDHVRALVRVLESGEIGTCYNIGGGHETSNLQLARRLCAELDRLRPEEAPHERLIAFVTDRPGHDFRYAIDSGRIRGQLGWKAQMPFSEGLRRTIQWYLENREWMQKVSEESYSGQRQGLAT